MAPIRTTLATAGTLAALGGLTAFAAGAGDARPEAEPVSAPAPAAQVRTEVVTRTIHRRARSGSATSGRTVSSSSSRGGGADDPASHDRFDDRGGHAGRRGPGAGGTAVADDHRGRGRGGDDDAFDDHSGHRGGGGDDAFDDHGGDDHGGGHGRGGGDD
jgi:hypothetical protein